MDDEDAFRAKVAMDHVVAVRVPDCVGNLADEVQARCEGQGLAALTEVVVEANFVGLAAEKDRGTEVVLDEFLGAENAGVFEALEIRNSWRAARRVDSSAFLSLPATM